MDQDEAFINEADHYKKLHLLHKQFQGEGFKLAVLVHADPHAETVRIKKKKKH
jgi:hypothetical protein